LYLCRLWTRLHLYNKSLC